MQQRTITRRCALYFSRRENKISREQLLVRVSRRFSNSFVKQVKDLVAYVKCRTVGVRQVAILSPSPEH